MTDRDRGRLVDGALLAAGTFTVLPVPPPSRVDPPRARVAMLLAPVAALPLGALVAAVLAVGSWAQLPGLVVGALAVSVLALGTRVLHLDGLADTVDGLSAPYDPERRRAIMKSGDVGPAGVVALVVALLIQSAALGALAVWPYGWLVAAALVCVSRTAVAVVCARPVPAATPTGLGAAVAGTVPLVAGSLTAALSAAALALALVTTGVSAPWAYGIGAVLTAAGAVALLVRRAVRVIGGITGDVIGAAIEVAFVALLVVVVAAG